MSNFSDITLPETPAEIVRGRFRKTGLRGEVIKKSAPSYEAMRKQEAMKLSKVLKLRFVDNLSYDDIAAVMKMTDEAVQRMVKPFRVIMENPEKVRQYKAMEPHLLDGVRMMMVEAMVDKLSDPAQAKKLDMMRLTHGFGILYDKARLERGESTANVHTLAELVKAADQAEAVDVTDAKLEVE